MKYFLSALIMAMSLFAVGRAQGDRPALFDRIEIFSNQLVRAKSAENRKALLAAERDLLTPELRKELIKRGNNFLLAGSYG